MKFKTLKTYQSVRFNQKDETHFDGRIPRFAGLVIEWDSSINAAKISVPGAEAVYVFSANIAYAVQADAEAPKKAK